MHNNKDWCTKCNKSTEHYKVEDKRKQARTSTHVVKTCLTCNKKTDAKEHRKKQV
jgi:hypothetical protein